MGIAAIVLAAGLGTRMKSALPKVLHPVGGRPMLRHLLDTVESLKAERVVVVAGPGMEEVEQAASPHATAIQSERLGTGHAVLQAKAAMEGHAGDVLILYGDTPLIRRETLEAMLAERRKPANPAVVVLGFAPEDKAGYGRLVMGPQGLERIVEVKDATPDELALPLCNSGVLAVDGTLLFPLLAKIGNQNAKGEYYLTDLVGLARAAGRVCSVVEAEESELIGVNSRVELAQAEAVLQNRLRRQAMESGVTMTAPETVFLSWDTKLGRDVTLGPNLVFGPGVAVADGVEIKAFCHLEGCRIETGAIVGPFARLRPGAEIGPKAHIGNFVEIKKAKVEEGAKVNHLTYIGDARIGAGANIGAGTITCNYDGFGKYLTDIGKGAFIGSNSSLVAPVKIGAGAIVGAGSVITKDVPEDALAVARGEQRSISGWASKFRARMQAAKAAKKKG
jgi:bifunctional UDP-N-acetylglucosamine pyrophosphorylase/glucosamine-1-phosphate N-acetyltransferase